MKPQNIGFPKSNCLSLPPAASQQLEEQETKAEKRWTQTGLSSTGSNTETECGKEKVLAQNQKFSHNLRISPQKLHILQPKSNWVHEEMDSQFLSSVSQRIVHPVGGSQCDRHDNGRDSYEDTGREIRFNGFSG